MAEVLAIWRCTECGKWSHATRKPKHHQRFIHRADEDETEAPSDLHVLREETPFYDHVPEGGLHLGGWWVQCGPFQTWTATPVLTEALR